MFFLPNWKMIGNITSTMLPVFCLKQFIDFVNFMFLSSLLIEHFLSFFRNKKYSLFSFSILRYLQKQRDKSFCKQQPYYTTKH